MVAGMRVAQEVPLLVLGDFNQVRSASEHFSNVSYPLPVSAMGEFQECLLDSGLDDLETRGVFFFWCNGRPEDPILRKLDKAFGNDEWKRFPEVVAMFEAPGDSDHALCVVDFDIVPEVRKRASSIFHSYLLIQGSWVIYKQHGVRVSLRVLRCFL